MTDPTITGDQCRAARGLLNITQAELAREVGVKPQTLAAFENGRPALRSTIQKLRGALVVRGITFLADEEGIGVRRRRSLKELEHWEACRLKRARGRRGTIRRITPAQSRAARGLLKWTQVVLAEKANLALAVIADFESGKREPLKTSLAKIETALSSAGVEIMRDRREGVCFLDDF